MRLEGGSSREGGQPGWSCSSKCARLCQRKDRKGTHSGKRTERLVLAERAARSLG